MLALCACAAALVLQDGRAARVMKDDAAIARFIQSRVVELANAAIASKGAFSMSIGSGTTVAPLVELAGEVDWTRVHLFFGNERTEGEAAGKCFDGSARFVEACHAHAHTHAHARAVLVRARARAHAHAVRMPCSCMPVLMPCSFMRVLVHMPMRMPMPVQACGVGYVYRVPSLAAAEAAVQYEAAVRAL